MFSGGGLIGAFVRVAWQVVFDVQPGDAGPDPDMVIRLDRSGLIETCNVHIDSCRRSRAPKSNLRATSATELPQARGRRPIRPGLTLRIREARGGKTRPGENRGAARTLTQSAMAIARIDRAAGDVTQVPAQAASAEDRLFRHEGAVYQRSGRPCEKITSPRRRVSGGCDRGRSGDRGRAPRRPGSTARRRGRRSPSGPPARPPKPRRSSLLSRP